MLGAAHALRPVAAADDEEVLPASRLGEDPAFGLITTSLILWRLNRRDLGTGHRRSKEQSGPEDGDGGLRHDGFPHWLKFDWRVALAVDAVWLKAASLPAYCVACFATVSRQHLDAAKGWPATRGRTLVHVTGLDPSLRIYAALDGGATAGLRYDPLAANAAESMACADRVLHADGTT